MSLQMVKIYTEKQVIENGYLVEDGKISDIQQGTYTELEQTTKGQNVLPGFIDIHIHGGYGETQWMLLMTG